MGLIIRIAQENELSQVANLISMATSRPITEENLLDELKHKTQGTAWHWWVALQDDEIIGAAQAVHFGSQVAGRFGVLIAVAPSRRRKGIGTKILDEVCSHLNSQDATRLVCHLKENLVDGLAFAKIHGFEIFKRSIASALSIPTFNEAPFVEKTASVKASGIELSTYANFENSEHNQRLLYEINRTAGKDNPGELDPRFMSFESWCKVLLEAPWFDPPGQIVAVAEGKFVGLSSVLYEPATKTAETGITGVARNYRGRGIALALKLEAIRYAQELGAERLITENDSNNGPMLTINKKLGFEPQKGDGIYTLVRNLE